MLYLANVVPGAQQAIDGLQKFADQTSDKGVNWWLALIATLSTVGAIILFVYSLKRGTKAQDDVTSFAKTEGAQIASYEKLANDLRGGQEEIIETVQRELVRVMEAIQEIKNLLTFRRR